MPTQSISLGTVTDATFNGSTVEQINLNGTGIWTAPPQQTDLILGRQDGSGSYVNQFDGTYTPFYTASEFSSAFNNVDILWAFGTHYQSSYGHGFCWHKPSGTVRFYYYESTTANVNVTFTGSKNLGSFTTYKARWWYDNYGSSNLQASPTQFRSFVSNEAVLEIDGNNNLIDKTITMNVTGDNTNLSITMVISNNTVSGPISGNTGTNIITYTWNPATSHASTPSLSGPELFGFNIAPYDNTGNWPGDNLLMPI